MHCKPLLEMTSASKHGMHYKPLLIYIEEGTHRILQVKIIEKRKIREKQSKQNTIPTTTTNNGRNYAKVRML